MKHKNSILIIDFCAYKPVDTQTLHDAEYLPVPHTDQNYQNFFFFFFFFLQMGIAIDRIFQ